MVPTIATMPTLGPLLGVGLADETGIAKAVYIAPHLN